VGDLLETQDGRRLVLLLSLLGSGMESDDDNDDGDDGCGAAVQSV
jgi:hypothetical protein